MSPLLNPQEDNTESQSRGSDRQWQGLKVHLLGDQQDQKLQRDLVHQESPEGQTEQLSVAHLHRSPKDPTTPSQEPLRSAQHL